VSTDERFEWRETYFVLFPSERRPTLKQIETAVRRLGPQFELSGQEADEYDRVECLYVRSPQDHSALEIDYLSGDEVLAQVEEVTAQLRGDRDQRDKLAKLKTCDARLEVMHFEEIIEDMSSDEMEEIFDPSALLVVLDTLVDLTGGVGIDPQSGTLL
jgi:hypothetical protein